MKQSTLVNLKGLKNRVSMNTKDLSGIAIVKRLKLRNTDQEADHNASLESRLIPRKIKGTIHF